MDSEEKDILRDLYIREYSNWEWWLTGVNLFYIFGWFSVVVTCGFLIFDFSATIVGAIRVAIIFTIIVLIRKYVKNQMRKINEALDYLYTPR